jgi:hypothetical protein
MNVEQIHIANSTKFRARPRLQWPRNSRASTLQQIDRRAPRAAQGFELVAYDVNRPVRRQGREFRRPDLKPRPFKYFRTDFRTDGFSGRVITQAIVFIAGTAGTAFRL